MRGWAIKKQKLPAKQGVLSPEQAKKALRESQRQAETSGLSQITPAEIDAEVHQVRRQRALKTPTPLPQPDRDADPLDGLLAGWPDRDKKVIQKEMMERRERS